MYKVGSRMFFRMACMSFILILGIVQMSVGQTPKDSLLESALKSVTFRNIGPALMSGRIADISIDSRDEDTWYIAVGSGGLWKTTNAGTTWTPVFDNYPSYSIGCVTIDPQNSHTIWVGTGENVGGRHVGYGDGIYVSHDGGKSFKNMGLKHTEHISRIIIHPDNSQKIWVAAQGPLWKKGGERGIYYSQDGGHTWTRTLGDDMWVGATDLVMDPSQPEVLYAATWQRHRNVAAYMGGGPGSGLHKSTDGGQTWQKLSSGLPTSRMGKIGLALSPHNPEVLYAAIELDKRTGAVYRSSDRGHTWTKMSETVSGATGPHYYQELYACPHVFDRLYLMDVRVQISEDGGKTFRRMKEEHKHSDNHAIAFLPGKPDYLLIGTDGGLYESRDLGENWRFFANLPVTQFYDIALDDALPFYNVYGGTQDNSTQRGPSRTDNIQGIDNGDWSIVLDWDGQQPATEPGNPNIIYAQRQEGTLSRVDMATGEVVDIQPIAGENESYERYNWDAPILVSPHDPKTIFFGSQRLWMSSDRGDSWTALSGDLTKNQERMALPIMDNIQSIDNAWDLLAMSNFNTLTMISQSPQDKNLIYVGTDDGLIQVTEDFGASWQKIPVSSLPGCPATAYMNEIKADRLQSNTVYVTLDNHKYGDFKPYVYVSDNRGKSWTSIAGDLPERHIVWRLVQDYKDPGILYLATEMGVFVTGNKGKNWYALKGGLPTIPCRDIQIQEREDDLVVGTFGRGIFILDDLDIVRELIRADIHKDHFFPCENAHWYIPRPSLGFEPGKGEQGAGYYMAPNPPHGVTFSYYLHEGLPTLKDTRQKTEKEQNKSGKPIAFPGWDSLQAEESEEKPQVLFEIKNSRREIVNTVSGPATQGLHHVTWPMVYADPTSVYYPDKKEGRGFMAPPGIYTATMLSYKNGLPEASGQTQKFELVPLKQNTIQGSTYDVVNAFWREAEKAYQQSALLSISLEKTHKYGDRLREGVHLCTQDKEELYTELTALKKELDQLRMSLNGLPLKNQIGEKNKPTIESRLFDIFRAISGATYGPTKTARENLSIVQKSLTKGSENLRTLQAALVSIGDRITQQTGIVLPAEF